MFVLGLILGAPAWGPDGVIINIMLLSSYRGQRCIRALPCLWNDIHRKNRTLIGSAVGTHCTCCTVPGQWSSVSALKNSREITELVFRVLFKRRRLLCWGPHVLTSPWGMTKDCETAKMNPWKCIFLNGHSSLFKVPSNSLADLSGSGRNCFFPSQQESFPGLRGRQTPVRIIGWNVKSVHDECNGRIQSHTQPPCFSFILFIRCAPLLNRLGGYVRQSAGVSREGFQAEVLSDCPTPEGQQELHSKPSCEGLVCLQTRGEAAVRAGWC